MATMGGRRRRRDWSSGVPLDLLGAIFNCLSIPDCLRVRAVCHDWRVASAEIPYRPTTNSQSPWLVDTGSADVYALSDHRSYRLDNINPARCIASSDGWLVFADQADQLRLLNPITGVTIYLPSVATLPNIKLQDPYFLKVKVFSADRHYLPMVFVSYGYSGLDNDRQNRLAYANAGADHVWTPIGEPAYGFRGMDDFAIHKGKLYGGFDDGYTLVVIDNPTSPPRYIDPRWPDILKNIVPYMRPSYYLMNSVDGEDLLLVLRRSLPPTYFESIFWVMKMDSEAQLWSPLPRLEESTAIFVGENRSMALSTRGLPELRENCIYFTRTECPFSHWDEGIFDLENGTISPLYRNNSCYTSSLYHWFTPAL